MSGSRLTDEAAAWFGAPNFGFVATIDPDGGPQLSMVWVTVQEGEVLFSTTKERRKYHNLVRTPSASILVPKPQDPYRYCEVRGKAVVEDDPGGDLIQQLSQAYTGGRFTLDTPATQRVIVKIVPAHVVLRA
ncbi:PPOX class F420-dependent oxidoreductase [Kibdelosporangium aridum]|uniref:PPOX class probable F420-dependent enzyme n=1 Tax=Kibdelosporangium aridum TaxID=2030 RepID=A0A1W2G0K3_KIBAR|nr:PPOX class F420-dependent oxidoreductase [Kibdelosporangium aridum]SMD27522.1 PPOX class probable F420-dependent enzyme [Kibdelosporangium aridum]